ncbi:MAG: phosphatase PAP2 family protein [Holophaga sp.]|nr:phosphatase PAP2 family protein [Holophaga sp.]
MRMAGLFLVGCLFPVHAWAQEPPASRMDAFPALPRLLWDDTVALVRMPGDWGSRQWTGVAWGTAAVLATGLALDRPVDRAVVRNPSPSLNNAAKNVAQLGGVGGLVLIGGGYLGSSLLGKDQARSMWVDAGIATVLARGTAFTLQWAIGRQGPGDNRGTHDFRPFSTGDSFPSGHASQAFAMASVVSMHADSPWVGAAAYGLAGLVGLARLETRDHFSSDVLAGALIGTGIGRAVVRVNQGRRAGGRAEFTVVPVLGGGFRGLRLTARF